MKSNQPAFNRALPQCSGSLLMPASTDGVKLTVERPLKHPATCTSSRLTRWKSNVVELSRSKRAEDAALQRQENNVVTSPRPCRRRGQSRRGVRLRPWFITPNPGASEIAH